jgi:hypothetical protein
MSEYIIFIMYSSIQKCQFKYLMDFKRLSPIKMRELFSLMIVVGEA